MVTIPFSPVGETSWSRFLPVARGPVPRERWIARARTMARDRPSPYGEGGAFFIVVRGPVPCDLSTAAENVRSPETTAVCCSARCLARDRPSPYGESSNQAWRGPVPRHRFAAGPPHHCRSGSPDPNPFGSGCSRTTEVGPLPVFVHPPRRDKYRNGVMKHPHVR